MGVTSWGGRKPAILLALSMLILFGLIHYGVIPDIGLWYMLLLFIATLITLLTESFRMKYILQALRIHIPLTESASLITVSGLGNMTSSTAAGATIRGLYLKKNYGLNYSRFFSTMATTYALGFIGYSILGVFAWTVLSLSVLQKTGYLLLFIVAGLLGVVVITVRLPEKILVRLPSRVSVFTGGIIEIIQDKRILMKLLVAETATSLATTIRLYLAFRSQGLSLGLLPSITLALSSLLSLFVSITPASLGIREGFIGFTSGLVGMGLKEGLLAAALDRIMLVITLALLSPIALHKLAEKTAMVRASKYKPEKT